MARPKKLEDRPVKIRFTNEQEAFIAEVSVSVAARSTVEDDGLEDAEKFGAAPTVRRIIDAVIACLREPGLSLHAMLPIDSARFLPPQSSVAKAETPMVS
jgi:hypothetical protein